MLGLCQEHASFLGCQYDRLCHAPGCKDEPSIDLGPTQVHTKEQV